MSINHPPQTQLLRVLEFLEAQDTDASQHDTLFTSFCPVAPSSLASPLPSPVHCPLSGSSRKSLFPSGLVHLSSAPPRVLCGFSPCLPLFPSTTIYSPSFLTPPYLQSLTEVTQLALSGKFLAPRSWPNTGAIGSCCGAVSGWQECWRPSCVLG